MSFFIFDMSLLVLIILIVSILLYRGRKNLVRDGPLILYKTSWGIKLINYVGGKYKKTLKFLSYISIILGYLLMISIVALIVQTLYLYLTTSIVKVFRAPPIMPLIPYFPKIFGLEEVFPSFPVVSFIISIIIVATVHEFSHGIFARRYGIRIKSTGFAFFKYFPAFFGAFVEQDDKQMKKKSKFEQMSVLSAGVFANMITAGIFFLIFVLFFFYAFAPTGIAFDNYALSVVGVSNITMINKISLENPSYNEILNLSSNKTEFNKIEINDKKYLATQDFLERQKGNKGLILLYDDAPAIKVGLEGVITEINGVKADSLEKFRKELLKNSPGDTIKIKSKTKEGDILEYEITLEEHPEEKGAPWIGIGFQDYERSRVLGKIYSFVLFFKEQHVNYEPTHGDIDMFIYDLLWWIIIINILVALMNMLPGFIFDGGMFWYLTVLGITKSEKLAKKFLSATNWAILLVLILLMAKWVLSFF